MKEKGKTGVARVLERWKAAKRGARKMGKSKQPRPIYGKLAVKAGTTS